MSYQRDWHVNNKTMESDKNPWRHSYQQVPVAPHSTPVSTSSPATAIFKTSEVGKQNSAWRQRHQPYQRLPQAAISIQTVASSQCGFFKTEAGTSQAWCQRCQHQHIPLVATSTQIVTSAELKIVKIEAGKTQAWQQSCQQVSQVVTSASVVASPALEIVKTEANKIQAWRQPYQQVPVAATSAPAVASTALGKGIVKSKAGKNQAWPQPCQRIPLAPAVGKSTLGIVKTEGRNNQAWSQPCQRAPVAAISASVVPSPSLEIVKTRVGKSQAHQQVPFAATSASRKNQAWCQQGHSYQPVIGSASTLASAVSSKINYSTNSSMLATANAAKAAVPTISVKGPSTAKVAAASTIKVQANRTNILTGRVERRQTPSFNKFMQQQMLESVSRTFIDLANNRLNLNTLINNARNSNGNGTRRPLPNPTIDAVIFHARNMAEASLQSSTRQPRQSPAAAVPQSSRTNNIRVTGPAAMHQQQQQNQQQSKSSFSYPQ